MLSFIKRLMPSHSEAIFTLSKEERNNFCRELIDSSSLKSEFYFLLVVSIFITMAGLLKNSVILIIGGMLVAPLLSPILSISLAIVIRNGHVAWRAVKIFLITTILALIVSMLIGSVFSFKTSEMEMIEKIGVNGFDLLIAALAGAAASLTWAKKNLSNNLAGVAITVTLLPPLVLAGIGLAALDYYIFIDAITTYLLNVGGIIIGSLIIFIILKFQEARKKVIADVAAADKNN
ncbi:MAG: TIGR00341 family protein [Patescibacteria group bacterium]|nr:TIGR00341 family protein [Patescibacteria group bacterium]